MSKGVGFNGIIGCIIGLYYSAILVGKRRIDMFLGVISSEHFARLEFKKNTSGVAIKHYNTKPIIQIDKCSEIQGTYRSVL